MARRVIRLSLEQYDNTLLALFGALPKASTSSTPSVPAHADPFDPFVGKEQPRSLDFVLTLNNLETEGVVEAAEVLTIGLAPGLAAKFPCLATWDDRPCLSDAFSFVAGLLFRRAITAGDVAGFMKDYDRARAEGLAPRAAAELVLTALLSSTRFLLRTEIGDETGKLTGPEIADAIAFRLTNAPPDGELTMAASSGALVEPEEIRRQIDRLFATKAAMRGLKSFVKEYFDYDGFEIRAKKVIDPVFANFLSWNYRVAIEATDKTVDAVLADGFVRVPERLMTDPRVYMMGAIDEIYGGLQLENRNSKDRPCPPRSDAKLSIEGGNCWYQFDGARFQRAGLLTSPPFLGSFADEEKTEFIRRGRFVRERFLCSVVPPPPENLAEQITATQQATEGQPGTARVRFAAHQEQPACSSCHKLMDAFAMPLEGYDVFGRVRRSERHGATSYPIDTSAELPIPGAASPIKVANGPEMARAIASSPEYERCFVRHFAAFALAREETCLEPEIQARYAETRDLQSLLHDIYTERRFLHRRPGGTP